MTKLFVFASLMTFSLSAFAEGPQPALGQNGDGVASARVTSNCDVSNVENGGDIDPAAIPGSDGSPAVIRR
jgi:hypothetical protein